MFFHTSFSKRLHGNKKDPSDSEKAAKENIEENTIEVSDESARAVLTEILIFIVFLVALTIVTNASQNLYMFFFNQTLERIFLDRNLETDLGIEFSYNELVTTADWFLFMEKVFLTNLHGLGYNWLHEENARDEKEENVADNIYEGSSTENIDNDKVTTTAKEEMENQQNDKQMSDTISRIFLRDNILLGPPRLRQIRVVENSCDINDLFLTYFTNCYAGYTQRNENNTQEHGDSKFYTMSELQVRALRGHITKYYGAGFVKNLSYDLEENQKILENLKANKWIDRGTRLIILEFVLFNINTNLFDNVKILAEIPPVGGIVPSHHFQSLKMYTLWNEDDWLLLIAGCVLYLLVLYYSIEKTLQCKNVGAKLFFSSIWNLMDILVLLLCYSSLIYNLIHPLYMNEIMERTKMKPQEFVSIDNICFWNLLHINAMAVCVFMVWIKIFKYISFNKTMSQFSITLRRCAKDLFGFAVMFFIVFLAYAQLGLLIFGASHPDFRKFGISVISLMRMFLGDFEYRLIEEANRVLGPIFFLTYVVFVFFILLNMFLAIINDTYGAVKNEAHKSESNFGSYLNRLWQKSYLWCFSKRTHSADATPDAYTLPAPSSRVRKRASEVLREYFEEFSELQEVPVFSKENENFQSFNKRLTLLEEVLEQLIDNMDRILNKVESIKVKKQE